MNYPLEELQWNNMTERDWNNPYKVKAYVENAVDDYADIIIDEIVDFDELGDKEEISERYNNWDGDVVDAIQERLSETIDQCCEVIYNYQARKIANAFDHDPHNDISDITGERYTSYNVFVYELLETEVREAIQNKLFEVV